MSTGLETKLNRILAEKNEKIIPENIKKGIKIFDIEGELESGIDTSDATATASDIINPKTAYVNGEKITGNNIITYKVEDDLTTYDYVVSETIENPIILSSRLSNKIVVLGTTNSVKYLYLCTVLQETSSITIDKKIALTSINSSFTSIPNYMLCSLSSTNVETDDANLYLAYDTVLYVVTLNFSTLTVTYKTSITAANTIMSLISNPMYINKCYYLVFENNYVQVLNTATFTGTSITKVENGELNPWSAYKSYKLHISDDGVFISFGGTYNSNESPYDPYLIMTVNGDVKKFAHLSERPGASCTGINPSGTRYYAGNAVYSITRSSSSFTTAKLGTVSFSNKSVTYGIDFINDNLAVICNGQNAYIYELDNNGLNAKLLTTIACTNSAVYNTSLNYLILGASTGMKYVGKLITNIPNTFTTASGHTLLNTQDANVVAANILKDKVAFGTGGEIIGTMPNNGALNYTPSTSAQTIPAGYTSGGTIAAVNYEESGTITPEEYAQAQTQISDLFGEGGE